MDNNQQNIVPGSSSQNVQSGVRSSTGDIYSAKITLGQKAQIFFKKYQYINGKKMSHGEAEQAARKEMNLPLLSPEEIKKINEDAKKPGMVSKIVDSKALKAIGLSKFIHEKMDWAVKDEQKNDNNDKSHIDNISQKSPDEKSEF